MDFKLGIYQHYKGKKYLVLGVARHTETAELLVLYVALYEHEESQLWVRPLAMFIDEVEVDGKSQPRFKFIKTY